MYVPCTVDVRRRTYRCGYTYALIVRACDVMPSRCCSRAEAGFCFDEQDDEQEEALPPEIEAEPRKRTGSAPLRPKLHAG